MEKKIRVLHIDDSLFDRQLVVDALKKDNTEFEIIDANSRESFEQRISDSNFDIVLSDFNILGFDGLQVLQAVKDKHPDLPVIIVTGTGSEEIAIQAMKMGAADYVIKSASHILGLVPTIKSVLEHKKLQDERRLALISLKESEELFRTAFENAVIGVCIIDIEGHFKSVNSTLCNITGYSMEQLTQMTFTDITYTEDKYISSKYQSQLIAGEINKAIYEKRYIHRNGRIIWVNISLGIVLSLRNKSYKFVAYIQDITERKQAETALKESKENLEIRVAERTAELLKIKSLLDETGSIAIIGGWEFDIQKNELTWTDSTYSIYEVDYSFKPEISSMVAFFEPETAPVLRQAIDQAIKTGKSWDLELPVITARGNKIIVRSIGKAYHENDEVVKIGGICQDITIIKQAEENLQKANKALEISNKELEAFTYSVSHDLRAPLRAILGFTRILQEDTDKTFSDEGRKLCSDIISNAETMQKLINDLLDFSHLSQSELHISEIDTMKLINSIYLDLTSEGIRNKTRFIINNIPPIKGDHATITQVWINLISNAIKYSSNNENPLIEIAYEKGNNESIYYIKDNGIGFDNTYADKIFDVFYRLYNSKDYEGTGVGLAIVKRVIHRHGGHVWAKGEMGKGSTFYIALPESQV